MKLWPHPDDPPVGCWFKVEVALTSLVVLAGFAGLVLALVR